MDGGIGESLLLENVLTGAAVGGGLSLLTGANPLQGALMGGLGGGLTYGVKDFIGSGATSLGKGMNEAVAMKAPTVAGATEPGIGSLLTPDQKYMNLTDWSNIGGGAGQALTPAAAQAGQAYMGAPGILGQGGNYAFTAGSTPAATQAAAQQAAQAAASPVGQATSNLIDQGVIANTNFMPVRNLANSAQYYGGNEVIPSSAAVQDQSFLQKYKWPLIGGGALLAGSALMQPQTKMPEQEKRNIPQFGLAANYARVPNPTPVYMAEGGIAALASGGMNTPAPANVDFMGGDMYPQSQQQRSFYATPTQMPTSAQQAMASYEPNTNPLTGQPTAHMAGGGIADIQTEAMYKKLASDLPSFAPTASAKGGMLKGPGDGMSDSIPGTISGGGAVRPARLADGEFVVPADVVSHLGNGSTDAGAKQLYAMMDKVRQARTGKKAQGKQINPNKYMPA